MKKFCTSLARLSPPVDTGLKSAGLVLVHAVEGQPVGENALNDALRHVTGEQYAQFLAGILLAEADQHVDDFRADQNGGNGGQQRQAVDQALVRGNKRTDGVHGMAEHPGVDLRSEGRHTGHAQRQSDEPAVRAGVGADVAEKLKQGHVRPQCGGVVMEGCASAGKHSMSAAGRI